MKTKILSPVILATCLFLSSCKKNNAEPPVTNNDPELLGVETNKIFHYSFNGSLKDGSGNNLDAADSANVSYTNDRFGRTNQALIFGNTPFASFVLTPTLSSKLTGFPFAVSFWFKTTNASAAQTLIKSDGMERTNYCGFWVQLGVTSPGSMAFNFGNFTGTSSSSRNSIITPPVFTANTWYHVIVNVRGANDMDFYINGTKNNSCTYDGSANSMVSATPAARGILGQYDGANSPFTGSLDDYRIYKKVLSPGEIATLYNFRP